MNKKEINPQLKKYLETLQETPSRDPQKVQEGRAQFLRQAETMTPRGVPALWERIFGWLGSFQGLAHKRWAVSLAGITVALFLALASVGGSVYASQNSLPGDALYPVKTLVENVQLRLENDPEDRIQLYSSFAHRRIQEIQVLLENGEHVPHSALTRLELHTDKMLQETAALREQPLERALQQIQFNLQEQSQAMDQMQKGSPEEADPGLQHAQDKLRQRLELISDGLKNPEAYQHMLQQAGRDQEHDPGKPENPGRPENPGQNGSDPSGSDQPGRPSENPADNAENGEGNPENGRPENPGEGGNGQGRGGPNQGGSGNH